MCNNKWAVQWKIWTGHGSQRPVMEEEQVSSPRRIMCTHVSQPNRRCFGRSIMRIRCRLYYLLWVNVKMCLSHLLIDDTEWTHGKLVDNLSDTLFEVFIYKLFNKSLTQCKLDSAKRKKRPWWMMYFMTIWRGAAVLRNNFQIIYTRETSLSHFERMPFFYSKIFLSKWSREAYYPLLFCWLRLHPKFDVETTTWRNGVMWSHYNVKAFINKEVQNTK